MAYGSLTVLVNSQLETGPKLIVATVSMQTGDTGGDIDFSSYFNTGIDALVSITIFTAAASIAITSINYTTVATTLTHVHTDPSADATMYITIMGR